MFLVNAEMHLMSEKKAKRRLKDEKAKLTDFEQKCENTHKPTIVWNLGNLIKD